MQVPFEKFYKFGGPEALSHMGRDFRIPETVKLGSGSGLTGPFGSYSLFAPGAHRLRVSEFVWEYFNRHQG